jgi:hypothetical protein
MRWCSLDLHDKDFPMQTLPTRFVLILGGILGFMFGASLAVGVGLVLLGKAVFRYSTLLPSATSAPASAGLTQEAL